MRYKTATMNLFSVMKMILGAMMGIGKPPWPCIEHKTVKLKYNRYKTNTTDLAPGMVVILDFIVGV